MVQQIKLPLREHVTVRLEGKTIPAKGFPHIYDSTAYMINAYSFTQGQPPNFKVVKPDIVKELSQFKSSGNMYLYHADINSDPQKKIYQTDVALQNPSNQSITLPSSMAVVGVNEIQSGVPGG